VEVVVSSEHPVVNKMAKMAMRASKALSLNFFMLSPDECY
jgi:hypothetical protein